MTRTASFQALLGLLLLPLTFGGCILTNAQDDGSADDGAADDGGDPPVDPATALSGTVRSPDGASLDGVEVIACVPDATGSDCDAARSTSIVLDTKGSTATFSFSALSKDPCYVLAAKDLDGDGVAPPTADLSIALFTVPGATGSVPADLVGAWDYAGSESAQAHTIRADGTWSGVSILDPSQCISFDKLDIRREGVVEVTGNAITFRPASATVTSTGCSAGVETKPGSLEPLAYTYALGVEGGADTLTLTNADDPSIVLTFVKQ